MKTKFAKEKSEYAWCIRNCIDGNIGDYTRRINIRRMEELKQIIKNQDDEVIFIVTTKKTNPLNDNEYTSPMIMTNIKVA